VVRISISGQYQWSVSVVSISGQYQWSVSVVSISGQYQYQWSVQGIIMWSINGSSHTIGLSHCRSWQHFTPEAHLWFVMLWQNSNQHAGPCRHSPVSVPLRSVSCPIISIRSHSLYLTHLHCLDTMIPARGSSWDPYTDTDTNLWLDFNNCILHG